MWWPAAQAPPSSSFSSSSSPTCTHDLKISQHYSPLLKSIDFFRFFGPKRVGLWGCDLLATADAWIQESKSLAEVWRLGLEEIPVKRWAVRTRTWFLWCFDIIMMLVVYSCLVSMFGWMWTYMWYMLWLSDWYDHPAWLDLVWLANILCFLNVYHATSCWLHEFKWCLYSQVGVDLLWIGWACF